MEFSAREGAGQLGNRMVTIQFQPNRLAQSRIDLAYRLLATLANEEEQLEDSVQSDSSNARPMANLKVEIQG